MLQRMIKTQRWAEGWIYGSASGNDFEAILIGKRGALFRTRAGIGTRRSTNDRHQVDASVKHWWAQGRNTDDVRGNFETLSRHATSKDGQMWDGW